MRGIFNTHGQNMSVAQGLRRHATTAGREPTCATRNMPTRNVSRTAKAVLPNRTARLAVQNGPFCTAMTKARQTGCGSTGCAKCHDMTKNSHHMAPHHAATTQPSHTATNPPAAPQTPGTSGRQTGTYRKPAQIRSENNRNGQRHCITTCRIETFFMFFHCRLQFYSYICIRLGAWEARQNATPRSHNATPGRH